MSNAPPLSPTIPASAGDSPSVQPHSDDHEPTAGVPAPASSSASADTETTPVAVPKAQSVSTAGSISTLCIAGGPTVVVPRCYYTNHPVRLSHNDERKKDSALHYCTAASSFGKLVRCRLCPVNYVHRACHNTSLRDLSEVAINAIKHPVLCPDCLNINKVGWLAPLPSRLPLPPSFSLLSFCLSRALSSVSLSLSVSLGLSLLSLSVSLCLSLSLCLSFACTLSAISDRSHIGFFSSFPLTRIA
jgi:hypothetical protein